MFIGKIEGARVRNRIDDTKFDNIMKNLFDYVNTLREEVHPIHFKKKRKKKKPVKSKS